ncbi:MAG: AAA family ATPase [Myxococcales bacterium]|nr:AAA family ATPase [Myxococcales bacterium]
MTVAPQLDPVPFQSNDAYLAWEMLRLQQRLNTYLAAKENPQYVATYHQLVGQLESTRAAGIKARREACESGVEIPFNELSTRFGLSGAEEEVLFACIAPHLSATNWHLLVCCQGSVLKNYLEVGFLAELIKPSQTLLTERQWFESGSPLLESDLLVIEPPPDGAKPVSLLSHSVYSPHYVAAAVAGVSVMDERLAPFCVLEKPTKELFEVILSPETRDQVERFVRGFYRREGPLSLGSRAWTLLVSGPRKSGKTSLIRALAKTFQRPLFILNLDQLERRGSVQQLISLAARNAQFLGAVLLMCQPEQLLANEPAALGPMINVLEKYRGLAILEPHETTKLPEPFETLIDFPIEVEYPDATQREQLWEALLPPSVALGDEIDLGLLANNYGLSGGQIEAAIGWAVQRARTRTNGKLTTLTQRDLVQGAKSQVRSKIGDYTDASKVKLRLEHLILPPEPMELITELLEACRNRQTILNDWGFGSRLVTGKGLVALFTGEAGTGKTLCAEILANELDLRLHIVSIPKVVSKWVGETEKNIRAIFNNARSQSSMLLFDEADSLFATRVKVEKAQDHFQNMEVNMLLQEIERFEGIVLLTTNLETNIDRAFQRRILFKIDFPNPEKEQRQKIWQTLIPKDTPIKGEIDFDYLADEFELTGGQIKNAIVRAAYRSVAAGEGLNIAALEDAAHQQAKEAGKLTRRFD